MAHPCRQALVVDDDAGVREVIADALRFEGIDVVDARGAPEALAALEGGCRPGIILLDLLMPGMSGERLLPLLRQHPAGRRVPIVAMSASPERLARIEGTDARLAKPFDLDALLDLVAQLCVEAGGLVLGIPSIDAEHRAQLDLAEAVAEALRRDDETRRAATLLDELIDCTTSHFSSEGELMRRHGFPDLDRHLEEHERCVVELERWREGLPVRARGAASDGGALRASIALHIGTRDRELARFLVARGVA